MARLKVKVGDLWGPPSGGSYGLGPWTGGAVRDLGGTDFLFADDDDYSPTPLPWPFHGYASGYINKNGGFTFNEPLDRTTSLTQPKQGYMPRRVWEFNDGIYPFWMDIDTTGNNPTDATRGIVFYGNTILDGQTVFQATWDNVATFPALDPISDIARNRFQLIFYPDGWVEFNYDTLGLDCGAATWSGYDLQGSYSSQVNVPLYGLTDRPLKDQTIVFILDVSGSISAEELNQAQTIALEYLAQVPAFVEVGVVEFATTPYSIISPTTDHTAVQAAIESAGTWGSGGSTNLYDGLIEAVGMVAGDYPHASVVIFSDGDTSGDTTFPDRLKVTKWAQVVVDYVDLYDYPHADYYMVQLVQQTGGRYVWHDRYDDLLLDRTGRTVWNLPIVGFRLYGVDFEFPGSAAKVTAFDYDENRLVYDAFSVQGTSGFTDTGPYALAYSSNCGIPGRYRFNPAEVVTMPTYWSDSGEGLPTFGSVWKYAGYHNPGGGVLKVKAGGGWHTADQYCHPGARTGRLKVKVADGSGPGVWGHASWMRPS